MHSLNGTSGSITNTLNHAVKIRPDCFISMLGMEEFRTLGGTGDIIGRMFDRVICYRLCCNFVRVIEERFRYIQRFQGHIRRKSTTIVPDGVSRLQRVPVPIEVG